MKAVPLNIVISVDNYTLRNETEQNLEIIKNINFFIYETTEGNVTL